MGHILMENRHGLVVDVETTQTSGTAEREAAKAMIERKIHNTSATVGADKGYSGSRVVEAICDRGPTAHVAQKVKGSDIDGRTTLQAGYLQSLNTRKRIEEAFG